MAIDYEKWNKEFGGAEAVEAVKKAKENEYQEVPDGVYDCALEKLELGENKDKKPMVKGMFRIIRGNHKKQCLFYNGVMAANNPEYNGFVIHNVLEFLRSLQVLEDSEIDFDGNFRDFDNLLMDIAEESEGLTFEIEKSIRTAKDGREFTQLDIVDVYE